MEYIFIVIGAIFVNNIVLSQFLGICPFLGVSKNVITSYSIHYTKLYEISCSCCIQYT